MKLPAFVSLIFLSLFVFGQEEENIVEIVDDLTVTWDKEALDLSTYVGLQYYCATKPYRDKTIKLLDKIHHYDTLLYGIVNRKFEADKDSEAEATLKDIQKLETDYTTKAFKRFIHRECNGVNEIENNYGRAGGEEYDRETKKLEKELAKYVESITTRIDIIDEHIHHLKLD
ncbi:MAG: hypothetical protein ABJG78_00120 [Cyclobacteriaceae bacterium]